MSAIHKLVAQSPTLSSLQFARMQVSDLPNVLVIENDVYPHPWTRGNFLDSLYSGYEAWTLRETDGALAGYFLVMLAVDEAHLLNISVRRDLHGKGVGRLQLDKIVAVTKEKSMTSILLEVRPSNHRALAVYKQYGFEQIGVRKGYYPAADNTREDAIVMRFHL
ncbi:ribosomal protein S18-alanine N-acetyltransferase [Noviherbaspirillum denitrificans]|uniref:[Ribosomal protein bS18]-alanine N-acetyltransferase n=1 Tax=Noviherbaspirillum denitrificans TaxID=1968433 RepID=A0A254TEV6_9BURK|nr:ribosomal protein S18-alanine N-acetyltransferase [Noviherbaspirillum denitrificans]OWW20697.1 ribosomal-protein-alanine acetyltransferase [Noviherbaspirillum denitrificans]